MKPNNIMMVQCTESSFYRAWIELLTPFHKLTSRERDVAARILSQYFHFKQSIDDPATLNDVLWTKKSRTDMRESLGMSPEYFQMVIKTLKKTGFLMEDDSIYKRYLPHKTDGTTFSLLVTYDWTPRDNQTNVAKDEKQD